MSHTNLSSLAETAVQARIRDKLNGEGVKLWLEPFYDVTQDKVNDEEILALVSRYSTELEISEDEVTSCMYSLQRNAIERLAERQTFQTTGLATLRLRFSGFRNQVSTDALTDNKIKVSLDSTTGKDVKKQIAEALHIQENGLKLICAGKVVDERKTLELQHVKNGSQIMVLSVTADHESLQQVEDQFKELEDTKDSADFLSSKDGTDGPYSLQVADQTGRTLNLPDHEKKALTVALALHEKGRGFMKNQLFSKAVVFLLEADTTYNQCQSSILEMVDNYGLLHLDIAWCYLSLQSISELPQVEVRLHKCEQALLRSYGADMERVIALKGSSGWEAALYVRLHLLQGVANYHLGHIERARQFLNQAEGELNRLKVCDDSLAALIGMGYGPEESRLALRSTYGEVDQAVDFIIRKREERSEVKKQEKEDLKRKRLQKKLGSCINGDPVNYQLYKQLKDMGYSSFLVSEALRRTNNEVVAALNLMSEAAFEVEVLTNMVNGITNQPGTSASTNSAITSVLNELLPEAANLAAAAAADPATVNAIRDALNQSFSEEALLSAAPTISEEEIHKRQKAYDTLKKDLHSEEDYIDLGMKDESTYLEQYKTLLSSL